MLPHFCEMYLKYLAGLCHHLAYIHHTHWVCMLQWSARKSWLVWCWFRKKRANKNKLLKKNITVNGFRTKCERVFFLLILLGHWLLWKLSFLISFAYHILVNRGSHIERKFQSVIHFKWMGKKLTNFSYPITALVFYYVRQQFSMHNK